MAEPIDPNAVIDNDPEMQRRLVLARTTAGLSIEQVGIVSEQFGHFVAPAKVAHLEMGNLNIFEDDFATLCRVYDVNPAWLRTGQRDSLLALSETELVILLPEPDRAFVRRLLEMKA